MLARASVGKKYLLIGCRSNCAINMNSLFCFGCFKSIQAGCYLKVVHAIGFCACIMTVVCMENIFYGEAVLCFTFGLSAFARHFKVVNHCQLCSCCRGFFAL